MAENTPDRLSAIERRIAAVERVLNQILDLLAAQNDLDPAAQNIRLEAVEVARQEIETIRREWALEVNLPGVGGIRIGHAVHQQRQTVVETRPVNPEERRGAIPVVEVAPAQNETQLDRLRPHIVPPSPGPGPVFNRFRSANIPVVQNIFPHLSKLERVSLISQAWAWYKENNPNWRQQ